MTRKIDDLGRVVIPSELRRRFEIQEGDYLDISVAGPSIILTKVEVGCIFCFRTDEVDEFGGRLVCRTCRQGLRDIGVARPV